MCGSPCTLLRSTQSVCMKYNKCIVTVVTYSVLLAPISPWVNPLYNGHLLTKFIAISPDLQIYSKKECIRTGQNWHCVPQCISY